MDATLGFGRFAGQAIDTRSRRSIEIVAQDADTITVDHFFHASRFFRAVLPRGAVARIHGQQFNFSGGTIRNPALNHAQARFVLDPSHPIRLYPLGQADGACIGRIWDFCYSVEVAGPRGVSWALEYSFGDFACAHRLLSTSEVVFERIVRNGYEVEQSAPLALRRHEMNRALEVAIHRSHAAGMRQPYYLLTPRLGAANCTSTVFGILDEVLAERYSRRERLAARLLFRLPLNPRRYLRLRNALPAGARMAPLNQEFASLLAEPEFRDRPPIAA